MNKRLVFGIFYLIGCIGLLVSEFLPVLRLTIFAGGETIDANFMVFTISKLIALGLALIAIFGIVFLLRGKRISLLVMGIVATIMVFVVKGISTLTGDAALLGSERIRQITEIYGVLEPGSEALFSLEVTTQFGFFIILFSAIFMLLAATFTLLFTEEPRSTW